MREYGLASLCLWGLLLAQQYYPFAMGASSGVLGAHLNPAFIADSRYSFDLLFMGTSFHLSNNYIGLRRQLATDFIRNEGRISDTIDFRRAYLEDEFQNESPKGLQFDHQILLPSFLLSIGRSSAIAFSLRLRNRASLSGIDYRLAKLAYEGLDYPPYWQSWIEGRDIGFRYAGYYDVALTYAHVLLNKGTHLLKGGVTLRYIHGIYGAYFYVDRLRFRYQFFNADSLLIEEGARFYWGHARDFDYNIYDKIVNRPFDNQTAFSLGGDVGLVYEFRPFYRKYIYDLDGKVALERRDITRYTLRLGIALLDIRSRMRFIKGSFSNEIEVSKNRIDQAIHEWDIRNVEFASVQDFNDTLRNRFGIAGSRPDFIIQNPQVLTLSLDWHVWGPLSVGGLGMIPFGKGLFTIRSQQTFSVYPRFETMVFTLGVPFTVNGWGERLWGIALKIGPFIIGTNSLGWVFGQPTIRTADIYFAFKAGLPYTRPRDKDRDGVSNRRDACPSDPGLWAFEGCPDSDGDHLADKDDLCPLDPGVPQFQGCPDTDGDDIPDKEDACPTEAGLPKFRGCPDRDSDNVPDKEDECPDEAGLARFKGCPDRDGDDVRDKEDECPDEKGLAQFRGCPDTDGDGIPDKEDTCPAQAGLIEFGGCPDTDRDGIPDAQDRCPTQFGPIENKGCPYADQDNDGIPDTEDDCPFTGGPRTNRGCPEIPREQKRILDVAFRNLEFETGKAIIRPKSFPYLDTLAMLLEDNPTYKLKISGHTDNQGTLEFNMKLSKARAEAVRDYLVSRGISGERFIVEYFGPLRPIASNATPQGRARNRRVEMKVVFD
ncbi:MAG: DUF5723 family protein [Bacteroidia bacterium]|nr:OmpA family protein [Bacteroidia bacterium]MDW8014657.1 DUF5723 family protein [Bacteroidia bacterium]